ncbi:MAG TPA: aminotransferase class IV [Longimicrobiales bacterium]
MIVWLAGGLVPAEDATISIHDRGFLLGDAVFETALLHRGGFFRLGGHLERFAASAATMRIPAPDPLEVDRIIREVVRANGLHDAHIRIILTRGVRTPLLLVTAQSRDPSRLERKSADWRIITARTRRPSIAAVPAQLKAVGRTYALLARLEAADAGVDDVLLLTEQGLVCEGPTWNVFWRRGDLLCTPATDAGVLAGVTRAALMELAPVHGFRVREGLFDRSDLDHADEIFATMTSAGIVSFRELDGRVLPTETGAADALFDSYRDLVARESVLDPL